LGCGAKDTRCNNGRHRFRTVVRFYNLFCHQTVKEEIKMYRFYRENGTWSYPVNKAYLEDYYRKNCADYGSESEFEDWFADMLRNDLIRRIWR
jgi:hypothetical protein